VPGAVAVDVIDGRIERVDDRHRDLRPEEFGSEVGLGGNTRGGEEPTGGAVPDDLDALLGQRRADLRQERRRDVPMDKERLGGIRVRFRRSSLSSTP
jgi:hypothetical protein